MCFYIFEMGIVRNQWIEFKVPKTVFSHSGRWVFILIQWDLDFRVNRIWNND